MSYGVYDYTLTPVMYLIPDQYGIILIIIWRK